MEARHTVVGGNRNCGDYQRTFKNRGGGFMRPCASKCTLLSVDQSSPTQTSLSVGLTWKIFGSSCSAIPISVMYQSDLKIENVHNYIIDVVIVLGYAWVYRWQNRLSEAFFVCLL